MDQVMLRIPTMLEDFDRYWQSEDGWARFWDLAQNKGSKATDWKLAVEAAFAAGYAARTPTISNSTIGAKTVSA